MAMDAIIADLEKMRAVKIGVAYLCTPTDAHVIPAAANAASISNLKRAPIWQQMFMSLSKLVVPKMALVRNSRKPTVDDKGNNLTCYSLCTVGKQPFFQSIHTILFEDKVIQF